MLEISKESGDVEGDAAILETHPALRGLKLFRGRASFWVLCRRPAKLARIDIYYLHTCDLRIRRGRRGLTFR